MTVSARPESRSRSIEGWTRSRPPSVLSSTFSGTSGQRSSTSASVGTVTPWPRNGCAPVASSNRYPASSSADLGEGELGHRAGPVGGAVDGRVVEDHHLAVGGQLQVHLEHVGALLERQVERRDRVGRCVRLRAGVGDDVHPRGVQRRRPVPGCGLEPRRGDDRQQQRQRGGQAPACPTRAGARIHRQRSARFTALTMACSDAWTMFGSMPTPHRVLPSTAHST